MVFQPTILKTDKGYEFFEVSSAFQKSVRRGDEDVALYFAVELFNSGYDEYLWKRMKIICSEDIGLAEPFMPATIQALYSMYTDQKKKKDTKNQPEKLFLIHAVLLLVRANKSRLVDWALITAFDVNARTRLEIPDFAYDKHNKKGRAMGRGIDHFWKEGSKLSNHTPLPREEEYKIKAYSAFANVPGAPINETEADDGN
jgi:replication-associated recombination protein RarA